MGTSARFDASMRTLGKRLEVMKKKNELSLLQNEVMSLESELRELEMVDEQIHKEEDRAERPRRHLPDIHFGRKDHVKISDPPELHLYDESSIVGTTGQSDVTYDSKFEPKTSTPSDSAPKPQDKTGTTALKSYDKSSVKVKPATYDGTGHWKDYKAHFDACAELNKWTDKEKGLYLAVSLRDQAQGVFGNLADKSKHFDELTKAL